MKDEKKITVMQDEDNNKIVLINEIVFKGKRAINWNEVEKYLKQYVGGFSVIEETSDIVYLGSELPGEYTGSIYTKKLKGAVAKAKANAAQGIPELIKIASPGRFETNRKRKHEHAAKYGWYRYTTRFALPVLDDQGKVSRINIFRAVLLVRHSVNGRKYLYDITEIKKKRASPVRPEPYPVENPFHVH